MYLNCTKFLISIKIKENSIGDSLRIQPPLRRVGARRGGCIRRLNRWLNLVYRPTTCMWCLSHFFKKKKNLEMPLNQERITLRDWIPHINLIFKVVPLKLFLVHSRLRKSQEDLQIVNPVSRVLFTRTTHIYAVSIHSLRNHPSNTRVVTCIIIPGRPNALRL